MTNGIYYDISPTEYHEIEGRLSCSALKRFADDPFAYGQGAAFKTTDAMTWGSAVDCLALTPKYYSEQVAVHGFDSFRTKEAKEWKAEQVAAGKLILSEEQQHEVSAAVRALRDHEEAAQILDGCKAQVAMFGEIAGVPAKGLLDVLPMHLDYDDCIVDLKTTAQPLDDHSLSKMVGQFRYHWQDAIYSALWNKLADESRSRFLFVFQRSVAPYQVRVVELRDEVRAHAVQAVRDAVERFTAAQKAGFPNPYATGVGALDLPSYVYEKEAVELPE